ncbi:polysaccharide deacetylase family protein [Kribbella sp. NBC_01505]|uniref:polysaccharide deacetylase family protein n=1 Tax=Kribbella sp. NBC_01505 TaxID=2903580 RepID=UPI003868A048
MASPPNDPLAVFEGDTIDWRTDEQTAIDEVIELIPRNGKGAVAFTWDDGWSSHPQVAKWHTDRGQRATFYVTTGLLGANLHMTAADVTAIYAMGHEIGAHNVDHTSMTTLTPTTRMTQWDTAKSVLEGLTAPGAVRSYAYPQGANDLTTNQEAYLRYDRVADIGLSQGYGRSPFLIEDGFSGFKHGRFPWSQSTHAQFMALLRDHVLRRPVTLTAYAHQIGNADTPTEAQVLEALDFCGANGIPCLTIGEVTPGPLVVNGGFENGLDGWTVTKVGAANTGATIVESATDVPSAGLSGTMSLKITSPNTTTNADSVSVAQVVPVKGFTSYSLSARVRHDATPTGTGKFSVRINEYDGQGNTITGRSFRGNASTTSWGQTVITPPADATWAVASGKTHPDTRFMRVDLYLQELTGVFYADHVHLGETPDGLLG